MHFYSGGLEGALQLGNESRCFWGPKDTGPMTHARALVLTHTHACPVSQPQTQMVLAVETTVLLSGEERGGDPALPSGNA